MRKAAGSGWDRASIDGSHRTQVKSAKQLPSNKSKNPNKVKSDRGLGPYGAKTVWTLIRGPIAGDAS